MARLFEILNQEDCSRILLQILKKEVCEPARQGCWLYFSDILGLMNFFCRGADLPSNMGRDSSSAITGKRSRVVEDEIYYDNYHVHKRYLTEVGYSYVHYTSFHGPLWLISKVHSARLHVVHP
jgi:hypothetical protein